MNSSSKAPPPKSPPFPTTVLIDGSALFLALRGLSDGRSLDYRMFINVLTREMEGSLQPPTGNHPDALSHWVMWTSWAHDNTGQSRFLEFTERELLWTVRRITPSDSFIVDPATALGITTEHRLASRLMRFDSAIAFAMGRLAGKRRIVVVSDSFPLAEPLSRAKHMRESPKPNNVVAFFGRALDPRWQRVIREQDKHEIDFVDLDGFEGELFGAGGKEVQRYEDDLNY